MMRALDWGGYKKLVRTACLLCRQQQAAVLLHFSCITEPTRQEVGAKGTAHAVLSLLSGRIAPFTKLRTAYCISFVPLLLQRRIVSFLGAETSASHASLCQYPQHSSLCSLESTQKNKRCSSQSNCPCAWCCSA
jgi:hypothetical protein